LDAIDKEHPILVVDDDDDFLARFERLKGLFNVRTEKFACDALTSIQEKGCCIIISDNRMPEAPGMPEFEGAGIAFLEKVREIDPHPLRVLVTSWSKEGITPSLSNHVGVNRLIGKLDVITDAEWIEELSGLLEFHKKVHHDGC